MEQKDLIKKANEQIEGIINESENNGITGDGSLEELELLSSEKEEKEVVIQVQASNSSGKGKNKNVLLIDKSLLSRIPRAGENVFEISKYPINEERDVNKASTICGYSLTSIPVLATALSDDRKKVLINGGDIVLNLVGNRHNDDGNEIFYDQEAAFERWETLMNASLAVATEMFTEAKRTKEFLAQSLKERNF